MRVQFGGKRRNALDGIAAHDDELRTRRAPLGAEAIDRLEQVAQASGTPT
jgi:hypothetical protein